MKEGRAILIAATYVENALDCAATGECLKGRVAIEDYMGPESPKSAARRSPLRPAWVRFNKVVTSSMNGAGRRSALVTHRYLTVWQRQPRATGRSSEICPFPMTLCDDLKGIIVLGWFAEGDARRLYERPTIRSTADKRYLVRQDVAADVGRCQPQP
jgi:hypothetical protein